MSINLRSLLGFSFLVAAAVGTRYWSQLEAIGLEDLERPAVPLGYYASDAVLLATDKTGAVRYRITAGRAEELPEEDRLVLTDVRIDYRPAANIPWRIWASIAEGPADRSYLDLSGAVEIRSEPVDGAAPVVIETDRLRLEPDTFIVSSDAPVHITMGAQRLRGTGLRAHLMDERLELESEVHGQILR